MPDATASHDASLGKYAHSITSAATTSLDLDGDPQLDFSMEHGGIWPTDGRGGADLSRGLGGKNLAQWHNRAQWHPLLETYWADPKQVTIAWQKLQPVDRKKSLEDLVEGGLSVNPREATAVVAIVTSILKHGVKKTWLKSLGRILDSHPKKPICRKLSKLVAHYIAGNEKTDTNCQIK